MRVTLLSFSILLFTLSAKAQLSPAITSWLQNTTETGSYYTQGNPIALDNGVLYNCQQVAYSNDFVYVHTNGIPAYPTGPFGNNNNVAESQNAIFRIPLNPQPNTGTPTSTRGGNIGIFINGVALFNYIDGVSWDTVTNALCGGPAGAPCNGTPGNQPYWKRDAILAEMGGFDCSKSHPANGNYHSHQNPSAFKLDLEVVSDICNLYDADGLYAIDSTQHSPLIGFAYDGYPIYGAYAYQNSDGTGGIVRIKSGYQLINMTLRPDGPPVDTVVQAPGPGGGQMNTLFLGYFGEDYEYIAHPGEEDYLDEHNGRFCITPEYPNGTYAYFATVDENWNSAFPYAVGPTYYGVYQNRAVTTITEPTQTYNVSTHLSDHAFQQLNITVFPNPSSDLIAIQINDLVTEDLKVEMVDITGRRVMETEIKRGSTIAYFDTQTLYAGTYIVKISNGNAFFAKRISLVR